MPGRRGSTRACLTLKTDQLEALRCLSRETGAPVAELARRAVDAFLAGRVPGYVPGPSRPMLQSSEVATDPATTRP